MATPAPTPSRFPIIDEYSNAVAEAIRTGQPLPTRFRESWIQSRGGIEKLSQETGIPPLGLESLLSTADSVAREIATKKGQKTPSFSNTPTRTATPTPTPTKTGGVLGPDGVMLYPGDPGYDEAKKLRGTR